MKSNPHPITGPWDVGLTLDEHTRSAEFLGYDAAGHAQFDTTRTELGELLFQAKYRSDKSSVNQLAEAVAKQVRRAKILVDVVVPVPPSKVRSYQPLLAIAKKLAAELDVAFDGASLRKVKETPELKSMDDVRERKRLMKRVFLGGSRRVSRLNAAIRAKLDEIVQRQMRIIIGDANGADRAMQRQLADWSYSNVEVFYVGRGPRNNVGGWRTRQVVTPPNLKGFDFYAAKDQEMAREAECGLMLWDGESRGTLANAENLLRVGKPVALYVSAAHRFIALHTAEDLTSLRTQLSVPGAKVLSPPDQTDFGLDDPVSPRSRTGRRTA